MRKTSEERVAAKMLTLINDYTIDVERVGWYIARIAPTRVFDNFQVAANSAIIEREIAEVKQHDTLF